MSDDEVVRQFLLREVESHRAEELTLTKEINEKTTRRSEVRALIGSYEEILRLKGWLSGIPANGNHPHAPEVFSLKGEPQAEKAPTPLTKLDITIGVFQKFGQDGLGHERTVELITQYIPEFNRQHIYTIFWKLKKKGLLDARGDKHFLTEKGKAYKIDSPLFAEVTAGTKE